MSKSLKILLVDDFEMVRALLRQSLLQIGYDNLTEAANGQEALEKIKSSQASGENYDLVFIDWNMPIMNGLEVVKQCKAVQELENIRFIMVSAEQDQKNIVTALKSGVSDYVTKPFSPKSLALKIERILERKTAA
jgi:two-component system chemotaxis response regulator CheY